MSSIQLYIYDADLIDEENAKERFFAEFKAVAEHNIGKRVYTAFHDVYTSLMRRGYNDWDRQQWDKFLIEIWDLI
jgi:hypothetical protein